MARAFGLIALLVVGGCGVDGAPVPPGAASPTNIQPVEDLIESGAQSGYF